jgi:hypothetical protein
MGDLSAYHVAARWQAIIFVPLAPSELRRISKTGNGETSNNCWDGFRNEMGVKNGQPSGKPLHCRRACSVCMLVWETSCNHAWPNKHSNAHPHDQRPVHTSNRLKPGLTTRNRGLRCRGILVDLQMPRVVALEATEKEKQGKMPADTAAI